MAPAAMHQPPRAFGYLRVSTGGQVDSGLGLAAQRATLTAEATRRGWDLELVEEDGRSAKDLNRPELVAALDRLDRHEADVLVVAKLDRLSRSVADFAAVLERARKRGWSVVCLDIGVDTSSAAGELMGNIVASTSQYERRLIGQRTREALAAAKAAGTRLGRPQTLSDDVVARIVHMRGDGLSLRSIGKRLEDDGVPTARGGAVWQASTVKDVLASQAAARLS